MPVKGDRGNAPTIDAGRPILTMAACLGIAQACAVACSVSVQSVSRTDSKRRSTSILHTVIREELTAREWSLSQLAEALGVRLGVVSRWLSDDPGKRVVPLPHACVQIAEALGLDVIEVFRLAGYLPPMEKPHEQHPHAADIKSTQRLLGRILKSIPASEWERSFPVAQAYLDGLQLILNRLDGNQ